MEEHCKNFMSGFTDYAYFTETPGVRIVTQESLLY